MYNVICRLPNASELINDIAFEPLESGDGMITVDPVEADVAEGFASILGYEAVDLDAVTAANAPRGRGRPSKVEVAARAAVVTAPAAPAPVAPSVVAAPAPVTETPPAV
jgi:hypothetical protein